jgi:formylmethanofuran dehydrogenase subunit D
LVPNQTNLGISYGKGEIIIKAGRKTVVLITVLCFVWKNKTPYPIITVKQDNKGTGSCRFKPFN